MAQSWLKVVTSYQLVTIGVCRRDVGGEKVGDNCLKTDEEKLEDMESMIENPDDDSDD